MSVKIIAKNKKARFEYSISENIEAGIMLLGTEVKSLREGKCSLAEGYIIEKGEELFLKNVTIAEYRHGNINNHDPLRIRKLLLHKKEILKLSRVIREKGVSVVPLSIYFKGSLVKVELGIGRGKKLYDKRESIKERDDMKKIQREMKNKYS
jgi:SsrA-binding protein